MESTGHDNKAAPASTVLVIEADILVRLVIAEYLRECGYRVIEGSRADEALAVLEAGHHIDAMLVDVHVTGRIDGFSLAREVRQKYPQIDVLLTNGVAPTANRAGDLCDEGPLDKPYHPQEVVRRIKALRERRRTSTNP